LGFCDQPLSTVSVFVNIYAATVEPTLSHPKTEVSELTRRNIQWRFNPPHSPIFVGLWNPMLKLIV